jgi:hypothetical protein
MAYQAASVPVGHILIRKMEYTIAIVMSNRRPLGSTTPADSG